MVPAGRTLFPQNLAVHSRGAWLFFQEALTMEGLSRTDGSVRSTISMESVNREKVDFSFLNREVWKAKKLSKPGSTWGVDGQEAMVWLAMQS